MAANIFQNGGVDSNWSTVGNWSLGSIPTASDGHVATFDVTSPNCTVNASARVCNAIDFTGYTNVIDMTNGITSSGNVTLDSTMASRVTGSGGLTVNATATLTSNGGTWVNDFILLGGAYTITLNDNLNLTSFIHNNSGAINGFKIYCSSRNHNGNNVSSGTTEIEFNGTGTWQSSSSTGYNSNKVIINTAGTLTISGTIRDAGNINYVTASGLNVGGNTLVIQNSTSFNIDLNSSIWNNLELRGSASGALNLISNININGNLSFSNGTFVCNGSVINIGGSLLITSSSANNVSGTTTFNMNGNGTISSTLTTGALKNNITIDSGVNIIILGSLSYNTGILTNNGNVITTPQSNLNIAASTTLINMHRVNFNTVTVTAGVTLTMNEFFCGKPDLKTKVVSSTSANYNVTFNSAGMRFAQYINVKNATLTTPCSLRLLGRETNGGNNVGVLFGDVGTKGFPKGMFPKPMFFNGAENGFKTNIN